MELDAERLTACSVQLRTEKSNVPSASNPSTSTEACVSVWVVMATTARVQPASCGGVASAALASVSLPSEAGM